MIPETSVVSVGFFQAVSEVYPVSLVSPSAISTLLVLIIQRYISYRDSQGTAIIFYFRMDLHFSRRK